MNTLILSKLFSSFEDLALKNEYKTYGMPSLTMLMKKVENNQKIKMIFFVKKKLFLENQFIIKKKLQNFNKDLYFINEYYFLKNKRFKIINFCLNEIAKFFILFYFIKKNKIDNIRLDVSSIIQTFFLSRFLRLKLNLRLYGGYTVNFEHSKKNLYSSIFKYVCKSNFASIICTNDGNSNIYKIKQYFPNSKKVKLIFNGSNFINQKSRSNYQLSKPLNIIFIGRLNQLKGPVNFTESAIRLKKRFKRKINFTIIGNGKERKKILSLIRSNGLMESFKLYEKLDHEKIKKIMKISDILICPSFIGYLSNVVIEATSLGLPVMACDDKFNIIKNVNFNKLQKKFNFQIIKKKDITDQIYYNLLSILNNPSKLYQMSNLQKKISRRNFHSWSKVINDEIKIGNLNEA